MKIVTYNLSCDWDGHCDGINGFIHRAGLIYEKIEKEQPDIIAFQEVIPKSLKYLKLICPQYEFYGQFRTKDFDGEGVYTAIKKELYDATAFESFWLSENPYIPGSRFNEQSECPRICVALDVRNKMNGQRVRILNLHLDHISDKARVLGMKVIIDKYVEYKRKNYLPTVMLGDFNCHKDSMVIKLCNDEGFNDAAFDEECTYHEFGKRREKLDYIFLTFELYDRFDSSFIWDDVKNGIYLSDHYPTGILLED